MEKALGLRGPMFTTALKTPGLKIVMGTDAVAGAHGQNAREPIERVKTGQKPMDAIIGMTSLAAESMSLDKELGAIAAGLNADLVADRRRSAAGHHRAAARAFRHAKWKGLQAMTSSDCLACRSISDCSSSLRCASLTLRSSAQSQSPSSKAAASSSATAR